MKTFRELLDEHSYRGWRDGKVTFYEWMMGSKELNGRITKALRHKSKARLYKGFHSEKYAIHCWAAIVMVVVILGALFPLKFTMQAPMNNVIWIAGLSLLCFYFAIKIWVMKIEIYELSIGVYEVEHEIP